MIEARDIHVRYGAVEALRSLSAAAERGTLTVVLGANGAGKTSMIRTMCGLVSPVKGSILLDGEDITRLPVHRRVRRGLALVPEGRRVLAPLTVEQNLMLGAHTTKKGQIADVLDDVHELFPRLFERRRQLAGLLSGGEQQMLAFGRALMSRPKYVLMDEPSMGLAPVMVDVVIDHARRMADSGLGVLMVEQNVQAALSAADHVVAVARGEVVFSGSREEAVAGSAALHAFLGEGALQDSAS